MDVLGRNFSCKDYDFGAADAGRLLACLDGFFQALSQKAKALLGAVGPLVVLARKVFPNDLGFAGLYAQLVVDYAVGLRFGKDSLNGGLGHGRHDVFNVIAV